MTQLIITILVIYAVTVVLEAYLHAQYVKAGNYINRTSGDYIIVLIIRGIVMFCFALVFQEKTGLYEPTLLLIGQMALLHWCLFDFVINEFRGFDWDYLPDDNESANSDRFFVYRKKLWILSKVAAFVMLIATFLL